MLLKLETALCNVHQIRGKCDFSDLDCGMSVGARQAGLGISISADLLEFSHTILSKDSHGCEKQKQKNIK